MIIGGKTGVGKVKLFLHIILSTKFFNRPDIYCYGPNTFQDDMKYLKTITDKISKQVRYDILKLETAVKKVIDPSEFGNNELRKLVIFDGMIRNRKIQDVVINYYTNGRHPNISQIYLTQWYIDLLSLLRLNTMHMVFYDPCAEFHRRLIEREHTIRKYTFEKIYMMDNNNEVNERNYDFLFVDKLKGKYYKNFHEEI